MEIGSNIPRDSNGSCEYCKRRTSNISETLGACTIIHRPFVVVHKLPIGVMLVESARVLSDIVGRFNVFTKTKRGCEKKKKIKIDTFASLFSTRNRVCDQETDTSAYIDKRSRQTGR